MEPGLEIANSSRGSDLWTGRACTGRQRDSREKAKLEENSQLALDLENFTAWKEIKSNFISRGPTVEENPQNPHPSPQRRLTKIRGEVATSNAKKMLGGFVVLVPPASLNLQILSFKGHSCCHSGCSVCGGGCRAGYKINSKVMLVIISEPPLKEDVFEPIITDILIGVLDLKKQNVLAELTPDMSLSAFSAIPCHTIQVSIARNELLGSIFVEATDQLVEAKILQSCVSSNPGQENQSWPWIGVVHMSWIVEECIVM